VPRPARGGERVRALEDLDVLRGGGKGHGERGGEFADVALAGGERAQHGAAGWVGQCAEDGIERLSEMFNHMV